MLEFPSRPKLTKMEIHEMEYGFDDNIFMAVPGLTGEDASSFEIVEDMHDTSTLKGYYSRQEFLFTLSPNVILKERAVFTFFDALGNVGGLYGILFGIIGSINNLFSFQQAENYLAERLYYSRGKKPGARKEYRAEQ